MAENSPAFASSLGPMVDAPEGITKLTYVAARCVNTAHAHLRAKYNYGTGDPSPKAIGQVAVEIAQEILHQTGEQ